MDYEKLKINDFTYWSVFLHQNQYYLGRVYLWAIKEEDKEKDILEMTKEEAKEFFDIGNKVKQVLKELFNPDRFNYANLQNESNHLHVHIIPRYEAPRIFADCIFNDDNYGRNYAPYNKDFRLDEEKLFFIRDSIKDKLTSLISP